MDMQQNSEEQKWRNDTYPSFAEWRTFFADTSIEGVRFLVKPSVNSTRKIFWAILVSMSFGFLIYQIQGRCLYYKSHPTTVDIKFIRKKTLRFPTVTICNSNFINRTQAITYGK